VIEGGGGDDAFAVEEFVREVTESEAEEGSGHSKKCGASEGFCEGLGELGVADGPRCGAVEGAMDLKIFDGKQSEASEVVEMNPGHPLAAIAERATEGEFEDGSEWAEGAAVVSEDDGCAEGDAANIFGESGFGFPSLGCFCEKALANGGGFAELFIATIPIKPDGGAAEEDFGFFVGGINGFDDLAGAEDATFDDSTFFCGGPESDDGFTSEMNEGFASANVGRLVDGKRANFATGNGVAVVAGEGDDFVSASEGEIDDFFSDEARRAGDADIHDGGRICGEATD